MTLPTETTTRRYFDERARGYYERNYGQPQNRHAQNLALRRDACLSLLSVDRGAPILDLGCGPGAMSVPLIQEGHRVVSVDLSRDMVAEASAQITALGVNPQVAVANAAMLPFADGSFAAVITTGVLEYVPELPRVMAEITRVLAIGGIVVATMSLPRRLERAVMHTVARIRASSPQAPQFIYDRAGFDGAVEASGLSVESRMCCGFAPFPLDAIAPRSVTWIDKRFARLLNRSNLAMDQAKTYIVRARRRY